MKINQQTEKHQAVKTSLGVLVYKSAEAGSHQ